MSFRVTEILKINHAYMGKVHIVASMIVYSNFEYHSCYFILNTLVPK